MATFHENITELYNLGNLDLIARQVVEGFIIGLHKSPFHGFSVEFAEHRLYNTGESVKNIDWKVYGRTDKMFVKRFEEETNLRCQLIIDASPSMYYPVPENKQDIYKTKIGFSCIAAAAIMNLLKKQRDASGLSVFSEEVEVQTPAKSSSVHHSMIMTHLERLLTRKPEGHGTNAAQTLHQIADNIHKRSLVVIFSDMLDNMEQSNDVFAALQHLKHNKHEVILFYVADKKKEIDFEFENRPYIFKDVETGEKIKLHSNQVKDFYVEQMQKFRKELELKCGQYKIDFVQADVNMDFRQILYPYLLKRSKMV